MTNNGEEADINTERAELFESISHPTRIRILEVLNEKPLGFGELKKVVGIESSGHLQFHLTKLRHLIKTTPEGTYRVTDDGKEALWSVKNLSAKQGPSSSYEKDTPRRNLWKVASAALVMLLVLVAGFSLYFTSTQVSGYQNSVGSLSADLHTARNSISSLSDELASAQAALFSIGESGPIPIPNGCTVGAPSKVVDIGNFYVPFMTFDYQVPAGLWVSANTVGTSSVSGAVLELRSSSGFQGPAFFLNGTLHYQDRFPVPFGIAFDHNQNLWVGAYGGSVYEFRQPFSAGMNASIVINGFSYFLGGLAFDSSGNLWIADAAASRIYEFVPPFSTNMTASLYIGQPIFFSSAGNATASNVRPWAMAFDDSGNLWASDPWQHRVLEYRPPFKTAMNASVVLGQPDFTSTAVGNSPAGMKFPQSIASDHRGNIWVSDLGNDRILEFVPPFTSGMAATVFGYNPTYAVSSFTLDASGNLWISYILPTHGTQENTLVEYPCTV